MYDSIAVVGATGAVGTLILRLFEERNFPFKKITFLASARSVGKTVTFKGKEHKVELLCPEAFDGIDLAIGSTPDEVAAEFCPWAVERVLESRDRRAAGMAAPPHGLFLLWVKFPGDEVAV